jgi:very-short-patch-repair endonuclease
MATKPKDVKTLTKDVLHVEYFDKERSTTSIAEEYGTNPKRISRLLKKHGYIARTRSEAQKLVVVDLHPTRGKKRTDEEKIAISKGGADSWDQDRKDAASAQAKKQWDLRTEEERQRISSKAVQGLREAAKNGSRMEHEIVACLRDNGNTVLHHDMALPNEKLEVDIWVTNLDVVIEVDGIFHVEPVYGEEKLQKTQDADKRKNNLLVKNGFAVLRLIITKKHISDNDYRLIKEKVLKLIKSAKPGKVTKWRYDG